jgi:murein DD-endopeptidase MepM/ murein hydrolase activator NlpD
MVPAPKVAGQEGGAAVSEVNGALSGSDLSALSSNAGLTPGTGGPGLLARGGPPCDPSQSTVFCVYTVEEGDTLSSIAERFGLQNTEYVTGSDLLVNSNRPDIVSEDDLLQIGQKLRVPTQHGVIHEVVSDETLGEIATRFDVTVEEIMAVPQNNIADANALQRGQILLVPNPKQFAAIAVTFEPGESLPVPQIVGGGSESSSGFIWPVGGPISSYFSAGHPLGIDIDLYNAYHTPVAAAMSGTVVFAGGNACCSYGYYVVVDHGNGFETLYAHLSEIWVSVGQSVSQGEAVGLSGSTGYSTGEHLHFEVHISGAVVDPLAYLP